MTKCDITFPLPLPDDPRKWQGWNNYTSPNYYERLCLDPHANPSNELIEEHCRELMRWWQKKLPLKNQPSNPLAQMLRSGLEESSRFLTEARRLEAQAWDRLGWPVAPAWLGQQKSVRKALFFLTIAGLAGSSWPS